MNRFEVDKFISFADADAERISAFATDPDGYVRAWVERGSAAAKPVHDGGLLDGEAARAFAGEDYSALYAAGAHPYLLFHFVRAVDMARGTTPWPQFVEWYRSLVTPHGAPDFAT
jgi:hypothetical protein